MYDDDGDDDEPQTDEEQKSMFGGPLRSNNPSGDDGVSQTTTTTNTRRVHRQDRSNHAPYLYSTFLSKKQDLVFAGGAGRNEMRVFDFHSGNIVGMVSNLPSAIMSGTYANKSDSFSFGCADSKVRIFNIEESNQSSRSQL